MRPVFAAAAAAALALVAAAPGCSKAERRRAEKGGLLVEDDDRPAPVATVGVSPLDFRCNMVVSPEAVEQAIGHPVDVDDAPFTPPAGTPKPCNYKSSIDEQPGEWSFDIDCREHAEDDGARLIAQYASEPGSKPVLVGRSGIDHHGLQILFLDDDAPCYVRVSGPGEAERLALARLVADGLQRKNAPGRVSYVEVTTDGMRPGSGARK